MPNDKKPLFTEDERKLLAEQPRDMAELYPTPEAWERSHPPLARPEDPALQQQYDDYARMEKPETKERLTDVTPEQQANVDKALGDAQISDKIGGASDGGNPIPNDPTPIEKARDIGQDLHKAGVTMDKE